MVSTGIDDLRSQFQEALGKELFDDATTNFNLYAQADEVDVLEHPDSIAGLLLSLGVEPLQKIEKLSLQDLLEILKKQVEDADPLDGICLELADKFDHEFTGECTYKQLVEFLEGENWFGGDEVELAKKTQELCGGSLFCDDQSVIKYRETIAKLIS